MLDAVEKAGIIHMVAFNYRRTPAVALAKKYIDEGRIGAHPQLPRHLPAGLVGRPRLPALVALPEEDCRIGRGRRHRHPCRRHGALPRRPHLRGQRDDPDLYQDAPRPVWRRRQARRLREECRGGARRGRRGRRGRDAAEVRERRHRLARGDAQRLRPQQLHHLRDPRHQGLDRLQLRAPRRAAGDVRRRPG